MSASSGHGYITFMLAYLITFLTKITILLLVVVVFFKLFTIIIIIKLLTPEVQ